MSALLLRGSSFDTDSFMDYFSVLSGVRFRWNFRQINPRFFYLPNAISWFTAVQRLSQVDFSGFFATRFVAAATFQNYENFKLKIGLLPHLSDMI